MARLPIPGSDDGTWGDILNAYLLQSLTADGSIRTGVVGSPQLADTAVTSAKLAPSAVTASHLSTGSVTNSAIADGAIAQGKIANLSGDLAGKAGSVHTHTASQLSDATTAGRTLITAADATAQRTALGLGSAATLTVGTTAGTVAAGDDSRITGALQTSGLDAATAGLVGDGGSETRASLSSTFAPGPVVSAPAGFSLAHLTAPRISRLGGGRFATNIADVIAALRPAAGVTYYVSPGGSAGASGLSSSVPTTLAVAAAKSDVGTIVFAPGEYYRDPHNTPPGQTRSINYLASGPGVRVTGYNNPTATTWTNYSGYIYQTTRSATASVVDQVNRETWGDLKQYVQKANVGAITGAGQWAISGSTVYVWAIGDTDLSAGATQIRLTVSATTGVNHAGSSVAYVEGIDFEGNTSSAINVSGTAKVIAVDCTFKYAPATNAVTINGGTGAIVVRCEASGAGTDGFNYHASGGDVPDFIEVDCTSHHNGIWTDTSINNATTSHETVRGIRVGGNYYDCGGPVVADVNEARTWNLGCRAGDSITVTGTPVPSGSSVAWLVSSSAAPNNATAWLDECTSASTDYAHGVQASADGRMYVHAPRYDVGTKRAISLTSGAAVTYYTP